MSADNGTYILKTIDGQYRVVMEQAIENIFTNYSTDRYDPLQVVLTWGDCRYTKDKIKAYEVAETIERKWHGTEYGIKTFEYRKPWKYIVEDAKSQAKIIKENMLVLAKEKDLSWYEKYQLESAEKIINM